MARPIIALVSPKGGVGKTTLGACLAAEIHKRGQQVVLVDADPQGALAEWRGEDGSDRPLAEIPLIVDPSEGVADKVRAAAAKAIVFVDTAGFANKTQVAVLEVADLVLIPCRPGAMDARGAMAAVDMVATVNRDRRRKARAAVVMNAATRAQMVAHVRNALVSGGATVLGSEIGNRTVFAEAELYGSAPCWMGRAADKAAGEVAALATEILKSS
jgi:chromosome partitioning protein